MSVKRTLFRQTKVNAKIDEVWDFFSTPLNLPRITPPDMGFIVHTEDIPSDISEGMLIEYTVRPGFNIPTKWITRIGTVKEKAYFIDEQLKGPYKKWEHSHVFEEYEDGILMTDHVLYELPGGAFGKIAEGWISSRLNHIFDYREKAIQEIFN